MTDGYDHLRATIDKAEREKRELLRVIEMQGTELAALRGAVFAGRERARPLNRFSSGIGPAATQLLALIGGALVDATKAALHSPTSLVYGRFQVSVRLFDTRHAADRAHIETFLAYAIGRAFGKTARVTTVPEDFLDALVVTIEVRGPELLAHVLHTQNEAITKHEERLFDEEQDAEADS